jgi:cell division protein FtsI (penicillin-binding protein 3)
MSTRTRTRPEFESSDVDFRNRNLTKRVKSMRLLSILIFMILAIPLVYAQAFVSPQDVLKNSGTQIQTVAVPAVRGQIVDRNGVILAVTVDARNVIADQTLVTDPVGEARKLANYLDLDPADLALRLNGERRYVMLKRNVTPTTWDQIETMGLPGIFSERSQARSYPEGELGANILGYVNSTGTGTGGVEMMLNSVLAGTNGSRTFTVVPGVSTADQIFTEAVDGTNVQLTIDRDIQWVAQEAIAAQVKKTGAASGSVVVMDPRSGEILAMATAPTFNPNDLNSSSAKNLGNRILTNTYEPGSIGKAITMATAMESGGLNPRSQMVIPAKITRFNKTFRDHDPHGRINLTLTGVLAVSSNIGSILAAETVSDDELYNAFRAFGIGESTGLGFPGESFGALPKPQNWSGTTKPTLAFGQGYSLNTLQATSIYATFANDGVRVVPKIISGYTDKEGRFESTPASNTRRVVSAEVARNVRLMMESVVSAEGTAPLAKIKGYRISGKTGTADYYSQAQQKYTGYVASFVGMAPADKPELVISVILERPVNGHYGGEVAAPVFKKVMTFALQRMRVVPTGKLTNKLPLDWR